MTNLIVDSKKNCLQLPGNLWANMKKVAQKYKLKTGTYVIRIKKGGFSFWAGGIKPEPFVFIKLNAGSFKNLATGIKTHLTFAMLNGFNDTITIEVEKTTNLYAFFLDSNTADNRGEVELSILRV